MKFPTIFLTDPRAVLLQTLQLAFMILCAFVFGLLAVTADPMMIGLGLGAVGGILLRASPRLSVLIMFALGLLMGAFISFAGAAFSKLPWAISLLGLLLLLPAFLAMAKFNSISPPGFIWLALVFMFYALLATALHFNSFAVSLAGFKRYFQVYGLMLALALLPFTSQDFKRWQKILLAIALLQFPFSLYELLVLVPLRGGLSKASSTTDVVAGTFGANMEGGSPAIAMVVLLLICFSFIFSRWRNGLISSKAACWLSLIVLLPVSMGENKIVVLMLPMIWMVLVRHDVMRSPIRYLPVLLAGVLMTAFITYVYVELIMHSTLADVLESTISYNFASAGYDKFYLNRTTVLSFWWSKQGMHDPLGLFFGHGLGSSFLGQISGPIGLRYPRHGLNLTAASSLLWDLGIVGCMMFFAIFIAAWRTAEKIYQASVDPQVRADCLAIQAGISLFLTLIVYSQDVVNLISMEILYALLLGYLAYLYRQQMAVSRGLPA
jgi:hypothetical protein